MPSLLSWAATPSSASLHYTFSLLISCLFLLGIAKLFSKPCSTPHSNAAQVAGNETAFDITLILTGINALVVLLVLLYDRFRKILLEAFWHGYVVALMVIGLLLSSWDWYHAVRINLA